MNWFLTTNQRAINPKPFVNWSVVCTTAFINKPFWVLPAAAKPLRSPTSYKKCSAQRSFYRTTKPLQPNYTANSSSFFRIMQLNTLFLTTTTTNPRPTSHPPVHLSKKTSKLTTKSKSCAWPPPLLCFRAAEMSLWWRRSVVFTELGTLLSLRTVFYTFKLATPLCAINFYFAWLKIYTNGPAMILNVDNFAFLAIPLISSLPIQTTPCALVFGATKSKKLRPLTPKLARHSSSSNKSIFFRPTYSSRAQTTRGRPLPKFKTTSLSRLPTLKKKES